MTITLKDFQAFANERMSEAIANPDLLRDKFREIMDFGIANEASMDAEANAHFDNLHVSGTIATLMIPSFISSPAPHSSQNRA